MTAWLLLPLLLPSVGPFSSESPRLRRTKSLPELLAATRTTFLALFAPPNRDMNERADFVAECTATAAVSKASFAATDHTASWIVLNTLFSPIIWYSPVVMVLSLT
jgi:hypothetical protein